MRERHWGSYRREGEDRIPMVQNLAIQLRGNQTYTASELRGKYFFHMDEGHFHLVDPHGFGIVKSIPRGLIASISIEAVE